MKEGNVTLAYPEEVGGGGGGGKEVMVEESVRGNIIAPVKLLRKGRLVELRGNICITSNTDRG